MDNKGKEEREEVKEQDRECIEVRRKKGRKRKLFDIYKSACFPLSRSHTRFKYHGKKDKQEKVWPISDISVASI